MENENVACDFCKNYMDYAVSCNPTWHSLNMNYKNFKQSIKVRYLNNKREKFIYNTEDIYMKYKKNPVIIEAI